MSLDVIVYRLIRLRRLILVAAAPIVLTSLALVDDLGAAVLVLMPLALALVTLHAVRYPNAMPETLAASVALSAGLVWIAGFAPDPGLVPLILGAAALVLKPVAVFLIGSAALTGLLFMGPMREVTLSSTRRSSLPAAQLKPAITYWPGRRDGRATCGPADADGVFSMTLHHRLAAPWGGDTTPTDLELFGTVLEDTPQSHILISVAKGTQATSTTRTFFDEGPGGTRVRMSERSAPMTFGMIAGAWLIDLIGDVLTDEIDRAEGRPARANRDEARNQLLFDLSRWLIGEAGPAAPPAE